MGIPPASILYLIILILLTVQNYFYSFWSYVWVHPKCGCDTVTVNGQHSLWLEGCKWTEHVKFANSCHNSNWWDLFTQDRQYKAGIRPIQTQKPSCSTSWSYSANWTICLYEAFKAALKASCLKNQEIIFFIYIRRQRLAFGSRTVHISALGSSLHSPLLSPSSWNRSSRPSNSLLC